MGSEPWMQRCAEDIVQGIQSWIHPVDRNPSDAVTTIGLIIAQHAPQAGGESEGATLGQVANLESRMRHALARAELAERQLAAAREAAVREMSSEAVEEYVRMANELKEARKRIAELEPFEQAVKAAHNGYDPEARKVMHNLKEPASPSDAIRELLQELEEMHERQLAEVQAAGAVMREAIEPVRTIYAPEGKTASDSDHFERGCPLTKPDIRKMQAALSPTAGTELVRELETLRETLNDSDKWSFQTLLYVGDRLLAEIYPKEIFPDGAPEEGSDPGPQLVRALRRCREVQQQSQPQEKGDGK